MMTVEKLDFDAKLEGYRSCVMKSVCHAETTIYDEDGQHQATECGIRIDASSLHSSDVQLGSRSNFVGGDSVEMCFECWPEDLVDKPF